MKNFIKYMLFFVFIYSYGQSKKGDIQVGFNLGLNAGNIKIIAREEYTDKTNIKIDYNLSLQAAMHLNESWSLKSKIIYDRKGYKGNVIVFGDILFTNGKYNLSYITVPMILEHNFGIDKNFYFGVGPYISLLVTARNNYYDKIALNEFYNDIEGGLYFNIGKKVVSSDKLSFFYELGFSTTLSNTNKGSDFSITSIGENYNNNVMFINVGILFNSKN